MKRSGREKGFTCFCQHPGCGAKMLARTKQKLYCEEHAILRAQLAKSERQRLKKERLKNVQS